MKLYLHKECGESAVETSETDLVELPADFPFTCMSCHEEIDDESEVRVVEQMSQ
jgi:hypothetical protein